LPAAPAQAVSPLAGDANPAAAEILALVQDQRFVQACAALAAGAPGPGEIPVAGTVAPPAAFLNLLGWLAQEAAQHLPTTGATVDGYLKGPDGSYVGDVASPASRARVLLERLQSEGGGPGAVAPGADAAERWLLESGLAELVTP
jgi:hypothetical protein